MSEPLIDIRPDHWAIVRDILQKHVPQYDVWAFGSRAKWSAKEYSDLDLVVITDKPLSLSVSAALSDDFSESDLPFKVDVVDWATTSEAFRKIIERDKVVVWKAAKQAGECAGSEWPLVTVGELADSISDTHKLGKDHLIFLNTSDILLGKILHSSYSAVCDWPGQAKKSIRRDDILFSEIRPANGRWAYVDVDADDFVASTKLMVIRGRKNRVVPRFLYHFLTSSETTRWLQHLAESRSGTFPQITFDQVAALELTLPPFEGQAEIAHVFDCIANKIELNRQMNETLEAMARALFKSWFVDFDPVRAKAEGRLSTSSGQAFPGLPKPIADLFPDSFEDSELGEIPKEWKALPLYETAKFINGAAFKSEDFCTTGEGLPVVKIAELKDGISAQTKWSQRQAGPDQLIGTKDLLYSWSGSPDTSLDVFLWTKGPGLLNQHIFKVVAPTAAQKRFVYYLLKYLRPILVETARNKQTTGLGHVTVADMKRLLICWPTKEILAAFNQKISPIFERAFANSMEVQILAALRDTLLPKLISGELRTRTSGMRAQEATS